MDAAIKNALLGICPTLAKRPEYLDPHTDRPGAEEARISQNLAEKPGQCGDCGCPLEWDQRGFCGICSAKRR